MPFLPALMYSRVICRTWGTVGVESWATATKLPSAARDNPSNIGRNFMCNLLDLLRDHLAMAGRPGANRRCSKTWPNTSLAPGRCKESCRDLKRIYSISGGDVSRGFLCFLKRSVCPLLLCLRGETNSSLRRVHQPPR